MGSADFETMRAALTAWYVRGDRGAGGRFAQAWLLPRVGQMVAGLRALGDERQDCVQFVVERFLDRLKARGAGADGFKFWVNRIEWLIKDFLRARKRLPIPLSDEQQAPVARPDAGADSADGPMLSAIARQRRARTLGPRLAALGPAQRAYFLVYFHQALGDLLTPDDVGWIAAQADVTPEIVRGRLAALPALPSLDALLAVLFSPTRLLRERGKCLDAFRKGRKRAVERLSMALGLEDEA